MGDRVWVQEGDLDPTAAIVHKLFQTTYVDLSGFSSAEKTKGSGLAEQSRGSFDHAYP